MSSYKPNIHYSTYKDDHSYNTKVVSSDIEYIAAIFNIVSRWKHFLKLRMVFPLSSFHDFYPLIQRLGSLSVSLYEVIQNFLIGNYHTLIISQFSLQS